MVGEVEFIFLGLAVLLLGVGFLVLAIRMIAALLGGLYRLVVGPFCEREAPPRSPGGAPGCADDRLICRDVACRHLNRAGAIFCGQCGQRL